MDSISRDNHDKILAMIRDGKMQSVIARELGISRQAIGYYVNRYFYDQHPERFCIQCGKPLNFPTQKKFCEKRCQVRHWKAAH